jgi:hypothetical protein
LPVAAWGWASGSTVWWLTASPGPAREWAVRGPAEFSPESLRPGRRVRDPVGRSVVVVAGGMVALVGAPADLPPPTSVVRPVSSGVARLAGVGDGGFAGAAGVVTWTGCSAALAERLAGGRPGGFNDPPGVVGVVVTLRGVREVGLESTAVGGGSARLCGSVSGGGPVPTLARSAGALVDFVVAALVAACAAFARTRNADAMAVAVRPNR